MSTQETASLRWGGCESLECTPFLLGFIVRMRIRDVGGNSDFGAFLQFGAVVLAFIGQDFQVFCRQFRLGARGSFAQQMHIRDIFRRKWHPRTRRSPARCYPGGLSRSRQWAGRKDKIEGDLVRFGGSLFYCLCPAAVMRQR